MSSSELFENLSPDDVIRKLRKILSKYCYPGKAIGSHFMNGEDAALIMWLREVAGIAPKARNPHEVLMVMCEEWEKNKTFLRKIETFIRGQLYKYKKEKAHDQKY